jgi:PAS domain S-box-containing protein
MLACTAAAALAQSSGAPALDRVTLQLKWKHQFQFAGYYAAAAQGYYRAAGLDVTLREAEPDRDPVAEVTAGRAEFGVGTSELVVLRSKRQPVVVLAAIYQHSPLVLLAKRGAGPNDIQALAGQPIMIEPQSAELFAYFKYEGVDATKLRVVRHTFEVADLLSGKVAAMSAYSTDEPFQLRAAGVEPVLFTPRASGIDFYGDNLFTTEAQVREHPARVRALREASLRGWDYALAHPDEIIDLIQRDYGGRKSTEHLRYEAAQTALLMHPGLIEVGHMNPGRWRHIADTYAEFGMMPRDFPLDGFLYEPNPRPDLRWLYWLLAGASVLAVAGLGWALPLYRFNRRLRQSERQYRELAENAPFPVGISDLESGRVLFANRRAGALFAQAPGDLEGEATLKFYEQPEDRERLLAALQAGRAVNDFEVRFHTRDGRTVWTLLSAGLVEFGGRRGVVVAFHDITQRRAMEEELRRAKETAESAHAAKSNYLAVMSHEIRTPLNGILGLATVLRDDPALPADARANLAVMQRSAEALLKLITDLLDFTRLDAGAVEVEQQAVNLAEFVRELATLFRPAVDAKGLTLRCTLAPDVPPMVSTDALRLRQILSNVIANAIKFTAKGAIEILVERALPLPGDVSPPCKLRFHVTDSGIGIAAEKLPRIFEPYVQADATVARRFGGTGLGLSISRRLAQLLGGGIRAQSVPGAGSTFTVEIVVEPIDVVS